MNEQIELQASSLTDKFPEIVSLDTRTGYTGFLVMPENLITVAQTLRDEFGYDYLSSVTGVDYLPENKMEVVYHFYRTTGGGALVLKTQVDRENPVVPSLTPLYPGAEFQEREAWDLLGIRFANHPDLRRILTWEGFYGHPLRKDWKEPFFEEETKPFKSRWPEGHVYRAEDKNPFHDNVQYPPGFDPEQWSPETDELLYAGLKRVDKSDDFLTEQVVVNLGPQHPSTHGVFRMVVVLDGETVVDLKPIMGYLHRNHEKIGERNTFLQNMPFTDRLDYVCSMSNNFGYALAVEKLMGIQPPERAEYIRVMMAELTRFLNHIFSIGFLLNDLGAFFTPMLYALEERELILDVFEAVSGSRMMCNYFRFGGVARDIPDEVMEKIRKLVLERLPRKLDEMDYFITNNEIVRGRCEGVGVLTAERAIALSASGPVLRASGVAYDVRRADPYSIYDRFEFDIPVRYNGDIYDRYLLRLDEMRQSLRILQQVMRDIPEGPIMSGKPQYQVRVPAGESYGRVEGPKGELGFYVVSNGKPNPWRYHVRAPTFINLTSLAEMCRGQKIADVVTILGSIDIVLGEVDR
ncbi:NADH:ubiquinone oxidoreductase 49 kD subunit 7 [Bellilinea caldifistulae]|nr:NADH-quinone oxidoreductase subunit D [Bellilinea caldifistulae]GAP10663.1 NADH:ubiquinone oxidoreductase 49 kD subunit 7 [Bellilinea caldifistulae]